MTEITVRMSAEQVAELSIKLCNCAGGTDGVLDPEFVWVSPSSLGGRKVVGDEPLFRVVDDASIGAEWDAFDPAGINRAEWTSATSGATLVATAGAGGDFRVTYTYSQPRRVAESWYLELMLQVSQDIIDFDDASLSAEAEARVNEITGREKWQRNYSHRELVRMGE